MGDVTPKVPPKQHPGERLANYFDNFFKTMVAISTLGSSITFAKIVQTPVEPWIDYGYSKTSVQAFLAISWLCFVLDLAITSFAASALSLWRPQAVKYFGTSDSHDRRTVLWYATFVSTLLLGLLTAAFIFLGLVMVAYSGPTGWAAVGFTAFFATLGFGSIVWHSPIGSKSLGGFGTEIDKRRDTGLAMYMSPEKEDVFFMPEKRGSLVGNGPVLTGDGSPRYTYREGKDGVVARGRYVDDRLSRGSTIVRPASEVRPVSESFPTYTADRRRARANRTYDDQMYGETNGQVPQGRAQGNGRVVSAYHDGTVFDDKDQSIHSSDANYGYEEDLRYDAGVPEATLRDKYYNPRP